MSSPFKPASKRGQPPSRTLSPTNSAAFSSPSRASPNGAVVNNMSGTNGDEEGFTKVLTKEEKRKLRKVERHRPSFSFDIAQFRNGRKIGIAHVRDLVLFLVADGQKPGWIVPEHKANITHTVILLVPGLLPAHLGLDIPMAANTPFPLNPLALSGPAAIGSSSTAGPSKLPYVSKIFSYGVPTRAPGDSRRMFSVMTGLLNSPLPEGVRKKKEEEDRRIAELAKNDDSPPFLYLLTPIQMLDNDYKLPTYIPKGETVIVPGLTRENATDKVALLALERTNGIDAGGAIDEEAMMNGTAGIQEDREDGWVETLEATAPPTDGKYPVLAIDCEMVETAKGTALARISIVDFQTGQNIFDELVKPPDPVTDYRTRWSGMTPERLSQAHHTLSSIQSALITGPAPLITSHTILLGHSLECDLSALRIRHPLCIDTALLFKHPRGPPYKPALKWLANKWLGREIQGQDGGHDSEEDARTCVDLLRLKIANGPDFGAFNDTTESIFERISRTPSSTSGAASGKTSAVCDYMSAKGNHGSKATTAIRCNSDEEVLEGMLSSVEAHDIVFGRFLELGNVQGFLIIQGNGEHNVPLSSSPPDSDSPTTLDAAITALNARITQLHQALPRNTAFILLTGHSDPLPMLELNAKRQKWERLVKEHGGSADGISGEDRWLVEDDRELERRVAEAREGMGFFCVK